MLLKNKRRTWLTNCLVRLLVLKIKYKLVHILSARFSFFSTGINFSSQHFNDTLLNEVRRKITHIKETVESPELSVKCIVSLYAWQTNTNIKSTCRLQSLLHF